jgi:hypothetical protein
MMHQTVIPAIRTVNWKVLYQVGGLAGLLMAGMYVITLVIYLPAYQAGPPPATVHEWFTLFQKDWLTGLFFLGFADIVIALLWVPLVLVLCLALRQSSLPWLIMVTCLAFIGVAVYLATNIAFSMLFLSNQYATTTIEEEKSRLLAAGQSLIAISHGTGAAGYLLIWLAGLVFSVVMLHHNAFGKATAYLGIVAFSLLLAGLPFAGYTGGPGQGSVLETVVIATSIVGGLLSLGWYIRVGLRLLKLRYIETGRVD